MLNCNSVRRLCVCCTGTFRVKEYVLLVGALALVCLVLTFHGNRYPEYSAPRSVPRQSVVASPSVISTRLGDLYTYIGQEQRRRHEQLISRCREEHSPQANHSSGYNFRPLSKLAAGERRYLFDRLVVNDANRYIYCPIPKCGSTSWLNALVKLNLPTNSTKKIDVYAVYRKETSGLRVLSQYTPAEIEWRLKNYFKFMFVRNPWTRLYSAYRDKMRTPVEFYFLEKQIVEKYGGKETVLASGRHTVVPFETIARYVLDNSMEQLDVHFQSFFFLCEPCAIKYDFVGHFENVTEEAKYVLRKINARNDIIFPSPGVKHFRHGKSRAKAYQIEQKELAEVIKNITPGVLDQLLNVYMPDYSLYGYDLPKRTPSTW